MEAQRDLDAASEELARLKVGGKRGDWWGGVLAWVAGRGGQVWGRA